MQQNYNYALQQVLKSEGGYTNDPQDPGGPTNFGITIADYRMYVNKNATATDVKNMHLADAQTIYRSKYWNAVNGDTLPSGVDYCVFDYGVNSGVGRANKVYNRLKSSDAKGTINAICNERLQFLQSLSTWSHFGKGWGSRVASVRANSLALANKSVVLSAPQTIPDVTDIDTQVTSASSIFTTIKTFFKDNFKTNIPLAAGSASAFFTKDWPFILGGCVLLAGIIWLGFYLYERKSNASV